MQTIGKRLAFIRNEKGYTQTSLAAAIGVSRGVISNIEYDQNEPLPVVTNALCAELGIHKEWLLTGQGERDSKKQLLDELYRVCSELSEPQQQFILETIKAMQRTLTVEKTQSQTRAVNDIIADVQSRQKSNKGPEQGR